MNIHDQVNNKYSDLVYVINQNLLMNFITRFNLDRLLVVRR